MASASRALSGIWFFQVRPQTSLAFGDSENLPYGEISTGQALGLMAFSPRQPVCPETAGLGPWPGMLSLTPPVAGTVFTATVPAGNQDERPTGLTKGLIILIALTVPEAVKGYLPGKFRPQLHPDPYPGRGLPLRAPSLETFLSP